MDISQTLPTASADAVVAAALCHEIYQPLSCLLTSLEHAHEALRRRPAVPTEQPVLRLARWLADAHATASHIARVVADVHGQARQEPRRMRKLDLRAAVRAAVVMAQPGTDQDAEIIVDAPRPAWVEGVDTRLVHVFLELFSEALIEESVVVVRVCADGDEVVTELRHAGPTADARTRRASGSPSLSPSEVSSPALDRAVVRHIIAAHGGRLECWPDAGAGVLARVTLPASRRIANVSSE
jgi:C4-dicarboxylate-specific signal transduction histidine kinase